MYLIAFDHIVYEPRGGGSWTLPQAMREVYGVGHARVLRMDGTTVVRDAGNATAVQHVPSGRRVRRGSVVARRAVQRELRAYVDAWTEQHRPPVGAR